MKTPIDTSWKHQQLKKIRRKAKELRKLHLTKRASVMNIAKNIHQKEKIINVQKIGQVLAMWKKSNT